MTLVSKCIISIFRHQPLFFIIYLDIFSIHPPTPTSHNLSQSLCFCASSSVCQKKSLTLNITTEPCLACLEAQELLRVSAA